MHNNRRNTRFGMFIVAIIVSLLVFLTGCSSAQNETDTVAPVIENCQNPISESADIFSFDLCFLFAFAAASTYAPSISGSDEYWMVGFSERAIDNDGFPAVDDFTLLVRSEKN